MKKSVGLFIVLNRKAFLLLGVMLSLAVFGIVASQSRAQKSSELGHFKEVILSSNP